MRLFESVRVPPSSGARGGLREAHLPTQQPTPCQEARLSPSHEHPCRPARPQVAPRQGPPSPLGLIWRIQERSAFARLSSEGRRAQAGVLWCTYVLDPIVTPPRVAFAIGRAYGPAVMRNRLRRRLRAVLATSDLPPGWYLVGAKPPAASRSANELAFDVQRLVANAVANVASNAASNG